MQLAASYLGGETLCLEACDMYHKYISSFVNETLDDDLSSALHRSLLTTEAPRPSVGEAALW